MLQELCLLNKMYVGEVGISNKTKTKIVLGRGKFWPFKMNIGVKFSKSPYKQNLFKYLW